MDSNTLPKGHIIGWTPPPSATKPGAASPSGSGTLSKNAKKRQKQREKKAEALVVKDNWDEEEEEEQEKGKDTAPAADVKKTTSDIDKGTPEQPNWAAAASADNKDEAADGLATELEKLKVR